MSEMDDLTVTRLCALAMGLKPWKYGPDGVEQIAGNSSIYVETARDDKGYCDYSPLTDDAQCLALESYLTEHGYLSYEDGNSLFYTWPMETSANKFSCDYEGRDGRKRAICLCAAHMQQAKGERDAG